MANFKRTKESKEGNAAKTTNYEHKINYLLDKNNDDKTVIFLPQNNKKKLFWKKQNFRKSVNMKKNFPYLRLKHRL